MSKRIRFNNGDLARASIVTPAPIAGPPINLEALAQQAKAGRAAACQAKINTALKEHNCRIDIIQVYVNGQMREMQISLVALDIQPSIPNK